MTQASNNHQLCSVVLLGNLVATPEIRYQANPVIAVTHFTLATHASWRDKSTNTTKQWTSYHNIKAIGNLVEQSLLHAKKGDIVLIRGYLANNKLDKKEIVSADFVQLFAKGFSQSINQIHCSGTIIAPIQLRITEHNKSLVLTSISIQHQVYSHLANKLETHNSERVLHIWGKQGQYLIDHASEGDQVIIEGKLNYSNTSNKEQFIEGKQVQLIKQG
jgi:single-strand DNA-binding protein